MKIKIILLITALTSLTIISSFAQESDKGLYIKIYGGHSLFTPGSDQLFTSPGYFYTPENNGVAQVNSNGRYGAGFNFGVEVQKDMGSIFIAGLTINYLSGKQLSSYSTILPTYSLTYIETQTGKLSVLSAIPNISYKIFTKPGYYIYAKLGVILAIDTKYSSSGSTNYTNFTQQLDTYSDQWKYGLNAGVQAAVGVQFKLTRRLKGFVELSDNFLTVAANSFAFQEQTHSHAGALVAMDYDNVTFVKSSTGNVKGTNTSTTTGNVTTNIFTASEPGIYQHANSTVLNVGVAFAIK